jgi:hypothetical protein
MEEKKDSKKSLAEIIKVRGTGIIYLPENGFEFKPQKEGKPQQANVKKYGQAKVHSTVGAEPKRVITLQCREDAADPYSEFVSQFESVMKEECKKAVPDKLQPTGTVLKKDDDLKMTLNRAKRQVEVMFTVPIDPKGKESCKDMFYAKIVEISKCFAINESSILKSK